MFQTRERPGLSRHVSPGTTGPAHPGLTQVGRLPTHPGGRPGWAVAHATLYLAYLAQASRQGDERVAHEVLVGVILISELQDKRHLVSGVMAT